MRIIIKKILNAYGQILLSVFFGIIVFCFWCFVQRGALNYQEQLQMFLFDSDYFIQRIAVPGGLADYIAEFLTQFYYYPALGSLILAVCFVAFQRLVWAVAVHNGTDDFWYPFSFIPALLLWFYMGDESVLLSLVIALIAALLFMLFYTEQSNRPDQHSRLLFKVVTLLIGVPAFYWLFGSCVFVVVLYVLFFELAHRQQIVIGLLSILYAVLIVLLCAQFLHYPLYRLFIGINYYRFPSVIPYMQLVLMVLFAIFPIVLYRLPCVRRSGRVEGGIMVVLVIGGFFLIRGGFDPVKYRLMETDYLVRTHQWEEIISRAEKHQPTTPMGVSCVNLALEMEGSLPDRMFNFYQNGVEGLVPAFQRDFTTPLPTSEIFYQMGMVNSAERYAFEAQEAIPNYRKSSRCYQRMAECELINGQYQIAAKFLARLRQTLFYRKWADDALTCLYHDRKVEANPEWRKLRSFRFTKDFLFSESQMDQMFGLLFAHNLKNRMAYEYLMAWQMLERNLQGFQKYYPLGRFVGYTEIPRSYQEVLVYLWTQSHTSFEGIPYSVTPEVCNDVTDFARAYIANPHDPGLVTGKMGGTYWSYLLCKK
ncbi:MAG: DUF6057 family protein [Prevotella sp.]|nr:DUF6057 family protein [Prevotella sp.]